MYEDEFLKNTIAIRKLSDGVKDGTINADEAQSQLETLTLEKRAIEQRIAQATAPRTDETRSIDFGKVREAMMEKRAITLDGTGAINQVKELAKELSQKKEILKLVRYFHGPSASTNIPVLSPGLAGPQIVGEGATGVASDVQAKLQTKSLTPHAFISILPVSAEALLMGIVNIESELTEIFADAFADAFCKQILVGDGTGLNFNGLFNGITNTIECGTAGTPKMADLVKLAMTLRDYADDAVIVTHPTIYSAFLADATNGVAELYKEELIRNKTIEGVKVLLTGYAPSAIVAGSTIAVAGKLSDYGVGLAGEITIEPIKKVGDTNTYFQATMFANGTKIVDKNFYSLIAK